MCPWTSVRLYRSRVMGTSVPAWASASAAVGTNARAIAAVDASATCLQGVRMVCSFLSGYRAASSVMVGIKGCSAPTPPAPRQAQAHAPRAGQERSEEDGVISVRTGGRQAALVRR